MINLLDVIKKKLPIYISSLERENFLKEVGGLIGKITKDECFDKLFQSLSRNKLD